jgi:hypothetical protein
MRRPALTKRAGGCPAALPTVEEREAVARVAAMVGAVMEEEMREMAVREAGLAVKALGAGGCSQWWAASRLRALRSRRR